MNRIHALTAVLSFSIASLAQAQAPAQPAAETRLDAPVAAAGLPPPVAGDISAMKLTVRARVVEIDRQNRSITVRGPRNRLMTKQVPSGITQFDELNVGDVLDLTYSAALAVLIEPYGSGIRERVEWQGSNAAGLETGRGLEVVATIERVDRATRTVTLRGAKRTVTMQAPAGLDVSKLKAGQEVRALFIDAAVIDLRRLTPQEAARQTPDHPVPVR